MLAAVGFGGVVFALIEGRTYGWVQATGEQLSVRGWTWPWSVSPVPVALIVSVGEFGLLFALPLWFQSVLGYAAFQTGLVLLASLSLGSGRLPSRDEESAI